MIKIIGIGNEVMGDDGIAIKVLKEIRNKIEKLDKNIEVVIGETDFIYCLNKTNDDDFVIIVDSTYFDLDPGSVNLFSFEQACKYLNSSDSQHQISLVNTIKTYHENISGYIIGIEVFSLDFSLNLSDVLISRFSEICNKVYKIIKNILEGIKTGEYDA